MAGHLGIRSGAAGCNCGECPVWSEYDLNSYYFCKQGAAV